MGIFSKNKNKSGGDKKSSRKRNLKITFSVLALSIGISYTWYQKDKDTGERQPAEKSITVTKDDSAAVGDTVFHWNNDSKLEESVSDSTQ